MTTAKERTDFLRSRKGGMGGTDMSMLLGIGFGDEDALDLYYDKTRPFDPDAPEDQTIHQLRGQVTEATGAALYWGHTEREGRKAPEVVRHPDFPAFKCHLDYTIFADARREEGKEPTGVLDIKCPMSGVFGNIHEKGIRQSELVQMQTYLAVSRRQWGSLGYCNLEHKEGPILTVDVLADEKLGSFLLELGQRFWTEHVLLGIPPDPEEWKVLGREDTPPVVERDGAILVLEPDFGDNEVYYAFEEQATNLLDAIDLRKRGTVLEKAGKKAVQGLMEEHTDTDRIEIPNVGKFTIVTLKGRKTLREDTLRNARPIDRDKFIEWATEALADLRLDSPLELAETMAIEFDAFQKVGNPTRYLKPTDKRPEEPTHE